MHNVIMWFPDRSRVETTTKTMDGFCFMLTGYQPGWAACLFSVIWRLTVEKGFFYSRSAQTKMLSEIQIQWGYVLSRAPHFFDSSVTIALEFFQNSNNVLLATFCQLQIPIPSSVKMYLTLWKHHSRDSISRACCCLWMNWTRCILVMSLPVTAATAANPQHMHPKLRCWWLWVPGFYDARPTWALAKKVSACT